MDNLLPLFQYTDPDRSRLEVNVNYSFGPPWVTLYALDDFDGEEGAVRMPADEFRRMVAAVEAKLKETARG
jgi:hypothetical protein